MKTIKDFIPTTTMILIVLGFYYLIKGLFYSVFY